MGGAGGAGCVCLVVLTAGGTAGGRARRRGDGGDPRVGSRAGHGRHGHDAARRGAGVCGGGWGWGGSSVCAGAALAARGEAGQWPGRGRRGASHEPRQRRPATPDSRTRPGAGLGRRRQLVVRHCGAGAAPLARRPGPSGGAA